MCRIHQYLRWQIELVIKGIKSYAALKDIGRYAREEIVIVMLYCRLLQALFAIKLYGPIQLEQNKESMLLRWMATLQKAAVRFSDLLRTRNYERAAIVLRQMANLCKAETRQRETGKAKAIKRLARSKRLEPLSRTGSASQGPSNTDAARAAS